MCTVTYIPHRNSFVFTSNRDEIASRNATEIVETEELTFPKDTLKNGTWFVVRKGLYIRCLLNGAVTKHKHEPPYRLSRGLMVLELNSFDFLLDSIWEYDFTDIEPFTLIETHFGNDELTVTEMRWNGINVSIQSHDPSRPKIWSSSTLYSSEVAALRKSWLDKHVLEFGTAPDSIWKFHHSTPHTDQTINVLMRRDHGPSTISVTQFQGDSQTIRHESITKTSYKLKHQAL